MNNRPPRLPRWLLERALPADAREDISGDLEERYQHVRQASGARHASVWYCREVMSFSTHFLAERFFERHRHADMSTGISGIDLKLALRMLVRYPGLTIVGVVGMAVGMAIAAAAFSIIYMLMNPSLPLDEGERVVAIQNWDVATNNADLQAMRDFGTWRAELRSIEQVGAFRSVGRNLIVAGAQPQPVSLAEMSASGFQVARVAPFIGRHLLLEDERPDTPPVVVIGFDVWQRSFFGDPQIAGRAVQLGDTTFTIVGVMPEGFAFPLRHSYWIPLKLDPSGFAPRTGPEITVFGRLAAGATYETAQAEAATIAQRLAASSPATHQHIRTQVVPYTYPFSDMDDPDNLLALSVIQTLIVFMLVIVSVNVAILVYARTATRQGEIAVRTALGASRRRIVMQLFAEALVLAGVAAIAGIGLLAIGMSQLESAVLQVAGGMPFWMTFGLSTETVLFIVGLTVLAAAIVGVVPALKATGRRVQSGLQGLSAGSGARMQMGRTWTFLIVAQVAVAVALLPATIFHAWSSVRFRMGDPGFAAHEFLTTRLLLDVPAGDPPPRGDRAFRTQYAAQQGEFERQLEADPSVAQATFSLTDPGAELAAVFEVEGVPAPPEPVDYNIVEGTKVGRFGRFNRIGVDFLTAFDVPVLTGRGFAPGDAAPGVSRILVNRAFVEQVFGSENVLGRRLRYVGRSREANPVDIELGRWYEIVGVVKNFPPNVTQADTTAIIYHAAAPGDVYPATMAIRVRGTSPTAFTDRLRAIGASVDPNLQLRAISSVETTLKQEQGIMRLIAATLLAVTLSVIVLSAAGIYSLMSFIVARRRREIGIRAALGADAGQILRGIFTRASAQLVAGATLGMIVALGVENLTGGEMMRGHGAIILPLVAIGMTIVGLLAAMGPARRGLQIQPTEALRDE
jgi:putative ABC transport system permease protein